MVIFWNLKIKLKWKSKLKELKAKYVIIYGPNKKYTKLKKKREGKFSFILWTIMRCNLVSNLFIYLVIYLKEPLLQNNSLLNKVSLIL